VLPQNEPKREHIYGREREIPFLKQVQIDNGILLPQFPEHDGDQRQYGDGRGAYDQRR
jgi:hypothetical protein